MSLRSPIALITDSFDFYKSHFWFTLGIVLFPVLIVLPVVLIAGLVGFLLIKSVPVIAILVGIVAFVVIMAILLAQKIALFKYFANPTQTNSIVELYTSTKPLILPYLFVAIITGLIIMAGFILLIIPGLIFAFWYSYSSVICVLEDKKGMDALRASKALVSGHAWDIVLRALAFMVVYIVILAILSAAPIIGDIISVLVSPLVVLYFYNMYVDLKKIQNGVSAPEVTTVVPEPTTAEQVA